MCRTPLLLALALILVACDSTAPDEDRTTAQQRVEITGFEVYGVATMRESDGSLVHRLSDDLDGVFQFGALPSVEVTDPCPENVDVCSSIILDRPRAVVVTLSRAVGVGGETLAAGTDLSEFLSTPDRDALLSIPPDIPESPDPTVFVAFDPHVVEIPDGDVRVLVRWTTNDPTVTYTAGRTFTYTR